MFQSDKMGPYLEREAVDDTSKFEIVFVTCYDNECNQDTRDDQDGGRLDSIFGLQAMHKLAKFDPLAIDLYL